MPDQVIPAQPRITAPRVAIFLLLLILAACKPASDSQSAAENQAEGQSSRPYLGRALLSSTEDLDSPVPTSAYTPTSDSRPTLNNFEGILTLPRPASGGGITARIDTWNQVLDKSLGIRHLPPFSFSLVQDGDDIIPVRRSPQPGTHPYWEIMLEPGKAWDEPGDEGWTRVSLPFALQERNQNCIHNGMLTFLFRSAGDVSRVAYQVVSETCLYLKVDLWGVLAAVYTPAEVGGGAGTIRDYREEVAARRPVRPIEMLDQDYPDADPAAFVPAGLEHNTVFGFIIDGVHYRGGCDTRYGPYPFCDVLDIPSYSLAKSVFAGLTFLYLEKAFPGFSGTPVVDLVPECRLEDGRWNDVNLWHLLNMTTGNYNSLVFEADENADDVGDFFLPDTHAGKIEYSCGAYCIASFSKFA